MDHYVEYTLQSTLGALEALWRPALAAGILAKANPTGLDFATQYDASRRPAGYAEKFLKILHSSETKPSDRQQAHAGLVKARGNADAGRQVFHRICIACHKVGNAGAELGPDISKVGSRLKREELIESLIDPNAKIEPKYLATNVTTKNGEEYSGLTLTEDDQTLTLVMGSGQKQVVQKRDIQARETLKVSSMPEGLAQTMAAQEFVDLIEYLATLK